MCHLGYFNAERLFGSPYEVMQLVFIPCLIFASLNFGIFGWLLSLKPFVWLGNLSYSIYLWHFPIGLSLFAVRKFVPVNDLVAYGTYIILVLLVSHCSYYFFEIVMQKKLREKYYSKMC